MGLTVLSTPYLLGKVKGAVAAYSLRKLRAGVTNAIRVRRSTDNTELDIGFSGQNLDTTTLLSFVGSGSGYISKWYDLSGSNNDAVQTTATAQPRIVNNGVLEVDSNGLPCIVGLNSNTKVTATFTKNMTNASIFSVSKMATSDYSAIFAIAPTASVDTNQLSIRKINSQNKAYITPTASYVLSGVWSTTTSTIATIIKNNVNSKLYLNGTINQTDNTGGSAINPNYIDIVQGWIGSVSELIVFDSTLQDSQRQTLERNQGKRYNISVS